jgi:hypothetical protein
MGTEVVTLANKFGITESKAFLVWFGKLAFDLSDEEAYQSVLVEGPNDKSIDFFWIDHFANRVIVAQGKYSSTGISKPRDNSVDSLLSSLDWLAQPETLEQEGKPELAEAARAYSEAVEREYSIDLWFVYCGPKNQNIEQRIRVYNANPDNEQNRRSSRHCDLSVLDNLFVEARGQGRRIESATVRVEPDTIELSGGFGKGFVSTIRGRELVALYSEFGDELFARNVRLYLGAKKGSVNAGVLATLEDSNERRNFWAYNNGITMICDSFKYDDTTSELTLRNFSIVNGCQTTVSLHRKEKDVTDDVSVLLRVIGPPEQAIDSIIRFNNSQNQIRIWDISTQDPTQRRLQRDFENLAQPIYYDLRRGEKSALNAQQKKKFRDNGKMRAIPHDELAQYIAAYKVDPVAAYKDKGSLFRKYLQDIFPPDIRVEETLFMWKAGEAVKEAVRVEMVRDNEQHNNRGLLILKRGGRLYALTVFSEVAQQRNGPDYLRTITEKRVASKSADERIEKYAKLATLWYKAAVENLLDRTNRDLSVLVRDQGFAEMFKREVELQYRTMALSEDWLKGALPKLF